MTKQGFTTRNVHTSDAEVRMELVDGPFSHLDGLWQFLPLNKAGAAATSTAPAGIA